MPSPFIAFDTQYSAHTDVTINPIDGVVTITVAFHPNNRGGYNCKVWELPPPYTAAPTLVRDWVQGAASVGPFGHGASVALPTGDVLTVVPVGADSSQVKPSILIDAGMGTPYPLLIDLLDRIAALEQRLDSLPPTVTGPIVRILPQSATEGGELQLLYNGGVFFFDVSNGVLRAVKQEAGQPGRVLQTWS